MIETICDNCEKKFEVEESTTHQKARCPHCGDVRVVPGKAGAIPLGAPAGRSPASAPGSGAAPGAIDRAAALGLPAANGPEQEVMIVRPAMFRARPFTYLVLTALFLAGLVGIGWGVSRGPMGWAIGGGAASVLAIAAFAFWRLVKKNTRLRITTKRCVETVGVFSKASSEILHRDIRNFTVSQSFWERICGVGTIGISSAAEDETEIVMGDVTRPWDVHKTIDAYRQM